MMFSRRKRNLKKYNELRRQAGIYRNALELLRQHKVDDTDAANALRDYLMFLNKKSIFYLEKVQGV